MKDIDKMDKDELLRTSALVKVISAYDAASISIVNRNSSYTQEELLRHEVLLKQYFAALIPQVAEIGRTRRLTISLNWKETRFPKIHNRETDFNVWGLARVFQDSEELQNSIQQWLEAAGYRIVRTKHEFTIIW